MVDLLIVGSGLFGAVFAREMTDRGYSCLVLEKRDHIGGNVYTKEIEGIQVHRYGAHIFHTNDEKVWKYARAFCAVQPLYQQPHCQLSWGNLFHALQYAHLQ